MWPTPSRYGSRLDRPGPSIQVGPYDHGIGCPCRCQDLAPLYAPPHVIQWRSVLLPHSSFSHAHQSQRAEFRWITGRPRDRAIPCGLPAFFVCFRSLEPRVARVPYTNTPSRPTGLICGAVLFIVSTIRYSTNPDTANGTTPAKPYADICCRESERARRSRLRSSHS